MLVFTSISLLFIFLLSPYVVLFSQATGNLSIDSEEFVWALKNTLFQALGSALVSVTLGVLGGLGLIWLGRILDRRANFIIEKMFILPNMLPSLFVIISCLSVFEPFPYGKFGIILVHSVINIGLIAVIFKEICVRKVSGLGALALIEGAKKKDFLRVIVLGYLRSDIFYLFLFVFGFSLVSFNVPLIVGGPSGTTIEVLIYQNLVVEQNWTVAFTLSLIQVTIVGLVTLFNSQSFVGMNERTDVSILELLEWKWGVLIPLAALCVAILSPLTSIPSGLRQLETLHFNWFQLGEPILNSILLGLSVGGLLLVLSFSAAMCFEFRWWRKFILFYLSPGAILVGFAILISSQWFAIPLLLQLILGLTILYFAGLYRLGLAGPLNQLASQIEVAQVLGASAENIFKEILFPQILKPSLIVAAIGSMWACGDFALSSVLSTKDFHLALIVRALSSSYRLDAAQTLMILLFIVATACFLFWWRLGNVLSRKFNN